MPVMVRAGLTLNLILIIIWKAEKWMTRFPEKWTTPCFQVRITRHSSCSKLKEKRAVLKNNLFKSTNYKIKHTWWEIGTSLTWTQLSAPAGAQMSWGYHSLVRWQTWGVTSLQSNLAWTIAGLCSSIPRFPLARLWQADHSLSHILPSSPACLRSAGAQLPMISQALGIKSRTVWKDLQDEVEKHHPGSGHRKPPPLPLQCPSAAFFPSVQHSTLACGTGAGKWHCDSSLWWHHVRNDAERASFTT